jgi:hypothetical protein
MAKKRQTKRTKKPTKKKVRIDINQRAAAIVKTVTGI